MHSDIEKEFLQVIFGGLCQVIYMIILHGNIPSQQTKQRNNTWCQELMI